MADRVYQLFGRQALDELFELLPASSPMRAAITEVELRAERARRGNRRARICVAARSAARQPQRHLRFREQAPGARPPDPARDSRGLPQRSAALGFPGGAAVSRYARRGSGRKRSPCKNRSAFPASAICARFHARFDPPGAFPRAADSKFYRRRAGRRRHGGSSTSNGTQPPSSLRPLAANQASTGLPRAVIPPRMG